MPRRLAVPSPDLRDRLMQRVRQPEHSTPAGEGARRLEHPRLPFWERLLPAWGLASLFLIIGLAASTLILWQKVSQPGVRHRARWDAGCASRRHGLSSQRHRFCPHQRGWRGRGSGRRWLAASWGEPGVPVMADPRRTNGPVAPFSRPMKKATGAHASAPLALCWSILPWISPSNPPEEARSRPA